MYLVDCLTSLTRNNSKPKFGPDPRLKNESVKKLFAGMKVEVITKSRDYGTGEDTIERTLLRTTAN